MALTIGPLGSPLNTARYSIVAWDLRPVKAKPPSAAVVPVPTSAQVAVRGRPLVVTGRDWSTTGAPPTTWPVRGEHTAQSVVAPPASTGPAVGPARQEARRRRGASAAAEVAAVSVMV